MRTLSLALICFLFSAPTYAQGLNKEQFDRVLDKIESIYKPIFQQEQLDFKIVHLWESPEVNAQAEVSKGNISERVVTMFGGLARHEDTTEDSFTLATCHEIGHLLGGVPFFLESEKIDDGKGGIFEWYRSNEGQADYFATSKCARKVFEKDDNVMIVSQRQVPEVVAEKCSHFSSANDIAICQRSSLAAISMGKILGSTGTTPDLSQPDTWVVTTTRGGHANGQCRADTYFQGALCRVSSDLPLSRTDPDAGACNERNGDLIGLRPRCWYAPATPAP